MDSNPNRPGPTPLGAPISDERGRVVKYLRLSVTDRCNLACDYCASRSGPDIPHPDILRYEEFFELMAVARDLGVTKVRLTGGEPLVRRDFPGFLTTALERFPDLDIRLTTNGTLLGPHIQTLAQAGLSRVNISLDTLDPAKFRQITGKPLFHEVRRAVDDCLAAGMRVKINAVAIKGFNDDEMAAFVRLARTHPLDLRFIEFMPIGCGSRWNQARVWTADEILTAAGAHTDLVPLAPGAADAGPARLYSLPGGLGRIGVISPLSDHFCGTCNRLRVTAHGLLRTCLFSDKTYRLRPALRNPHLGREALARILRATGRSKPLGYEILRAMRDGRAGGSVCDERMRAIGG